MREIDIYLIARSAPTHGLKAWLEDLGASPEFIDGMPSVAEGHGAGVIGAAAKRCYMSFEVGLNPNITKVRRDWFEYFEHVISSGHGSVLEHAYYSFAIEGVSRVFTAEMNRHRAGWAISEGSMRYIRMTPPLPYWLPPIFQENDADPAPLAQKKAMTRELFRDAFDRSGRIQTTLAEIWEIDSLPFHEKKRLTSAFRRVVPMGIATGGVWTGNVRALRHVIATRSAPEAEEEIAHVFSRIGKIMVEEEPMLFSDFTQDAGGFWTPAYRKV